MNKITKIALSAALAVSVVSCTTNDDRIPSLCESFADYFPVGVMINRSIVRSMNDTTFIKKHYNCLTSEEEMTPVIMHPRQNRYRWRVADEVVDFAQRNNMKVRGNCLVRFDQMPDWMCFDGERITSKDSLFSRMKTHIDTIMTRYKGKIYCWDVVTNAVADDTTIILRQNTWLYQIAGDEYVEHAFRCAHEADSTALLFYNDYNLNRPDKLERTCQMLQRLIDKGVHIDGVGMEGHWSLYEPTREQLENAISRFRAMGLQVHITQLDVSLYKWEPIRRTMRRREATIYDDEKKAEQAAQYQMIFEVLRKNCDVVTNVTFWGLDDRHSWLNNYPVRGRKNFPLLFDTYRCPKPVLFKLVEEANPEIKRQFKLAPSTN